MIRFTLKDPFSLGMEQLENRVRLIVYEQGDEYVCRKERFAVLEKFAETPEAHIFRGRLQLLKEDQSIHVQVKGVLLGTVRSGDFKKALLALQEPA